MRVINGFPDLSQAALSTVFGGATSLRSFYSGEGSRHYLSKRGQYYPVCSGPCNVFYRLGPYPTLKTQEDGFELIAEEIAKQRMKELTPDLMRSEVAGLASRIAAAKSRH